MSPWPLFAMFGWGIGLVFHVWDAHGRTTLSESVSVLAVPESTSGPDYERRATTAAIEVAA